MFLLKKNVYTYVRDVNFGKQHKFTVLKIKSCVSKNKVIFFDFIGHKKIALVISKCHYASKANFGEKGICINATLHDFRKLKIF